MPRDYKVSLEDMLASAMRIHSLTSSLYLVFVNTVTDFHGRDCFRRFTPRNDIPTTCHCERSEAIFFRAVFSLSVFMKTCTKLPDLAFDIEKILSEP